jgi:hypothetical protein
MPADGRAAGFFDADASASKRKARSAGMTIAWNK